METPKITNADPLADLALMQSIGWQKVYVTTAKRPPKTVIMWLTPDGLACYPTPQARKVWRASTETPAQGNA